jgi:hypothetical protein
LLPVILCIGEAELAIMGDNVFEAEVQLDVGPLRRFLKDGVRFWNIAGMSILIEMQNLNLTIFIDTYLTQMGYVQ